MTSLREQERTFPKAAKRSKWETSWKECNKIAWGESYWSVRSERGCHSVGLRNIQHALDMMMSSWECTAKTSPVCWELMLCSSTKAMLIDVAGVGRDAESLDREALFLLEQSLGRGTMCCCWRKDLSSFSGCWAVCGPWLHSWPLKFQGWLWTLGRNLLL